MAGSYPGGFVTKSPTTTVGAVDTGFGPEGGSASGMWTLDQALGLKAAGLWPARTKEKYLWAWGRGTSGRLGLDSTSYKSSPTQIGSLTTWSEVATANYHGMAIKTDGTMWTWGQNGYGQLGINSTSYKSSPIQIGALTTWSKIDGGDTHSVALKTDGTMWVWGNTSFGALGDNTAYGFSKSSPIQVGALTTWSKIAGGQGRTMAIKTNGTLWGWGMNFYGQLGNGDKIYRSSPVQIGALTTWSSVTTMGSSGSHTMALQTNGTMWAWGYNPYGTLGDNAVVNQSSPIQIGALTTWSKIGAGGDAFSIALKTDGTMWTWGYNGNGALGDNSLTDRSSPVQIGALTTWSKIAASKQLDHCLAIKTDGTLWTWGENVYGAMGDGTVINRSSPVQIGAEIIGWSLAATGQSAATLAIKTDGTMWTWGYDADGQLGRNTFEGHRSSPVQIGNLTTWSKIANGGNHAMALKVDGTMWSWGSSDKGQMGDDTRISRSSPVQIGALTTWSQISAGEFHKMALKTDGTMWLWGENSYGRLGDNTNIKRSSPVQIGNLTTWSKISVGNYHNMALKTDGSLWVWGPNTYGAVGDNTVINKSSPTQVGSDTNWAQIAAGGSHSAAIRTDGTLWTWGFSTYTGQLGDNTVANRSSPVQVGALTTWSKIALGGEHSMALKTDGTLWLWGNNNYGILGDNTRVYRSSPVQLGSLTTWSSIACTGGTNSIAIETDGSWYSWGSNSNGSVGDNTTIKRSSPVQVGSNPVSESNHWAKIAAGRHFSMAISAE